MILYCVWFELVIFVYFSLTSLTGRSCFSICIAYYTRQPFNINELVIFLNCALTAVGPRGTRMSYVDLNIHTIKIIIIYIYQHGDAVDLSK